MDIRALDFGELQSEHDRHFCDHWVPNMSFDEARRSRVSIVLGAKGVGKSALRRYMNEIRPRERTRCVVVDLHDFRYALLADQVNELAASVGDESVEILTKYWRHLLLLHCLKESAGIVTGSHARAEAVRRKIAAVLAGHALESAETSLRVMLGNALRFLQSCLAEPRDEPAHVLIRGLTPAELRELDEMPEDHAFADACMSAVGELLEHECNLCVLIDGIDRVAERTPRQALGLVLNALVRAAARITSDPALSEALSVKVLMPRELFTEFRGRDFDHLLARQQDLYWEPATLRELVEKRIHEAGRRSVPPVAAKAAAALPNSASVIDRLLRYSMYRPRQVLLYLEHIRKTADAPIPSEARVTTAIVDMSMQLTKALVEEFAIRVPRLPEYLKAVTAQNSVVELGTLAQLLGRALAAPPESPVVETAVGELYLVGVLALVEILPPGSIAPVTAHRTSNGLQQAIYCEFSYKKGARHTWVPGLPPDTLVALHPMIWSSLAIRADPDYMIG